MEDKLENLINIEGVEAVFIFNNKAETIYHLLKRTLDDNLIEEIGKHIIQIFALNKKLNVEKIINMDIVFDKGTIITYNDEYFTLVVWLNKNAQLSLIRLNIDLVVSNLKNDSKFKKLLKKNKIDFDYLLRKDVVDDQDSLILQQLGMIK
jgi:predicted regulator of Ras-like GTPase activity (Roadblock/LC7/MglB family)